MRKVSNPTNPFTGRSAEWLEIPPAPHLEIYEEDAKSIINRNDSPDVGFTWSVNPYRGCFHGCAYCYARRSHHFIDFGAGTDFERRIVVKRNAPQLLEQELRRKSWKGETIVFSGITDCYQPLEATYELTRKCLEVLLRFDNPVAIITKGTLIERDLELLASLAEGPGAAVMLSIAFSDDEIARLIEPYVPLPSRRFRAMQALSERGIPVGLALAPIIPGLNDTQVPEILERGKAAGASSSFMNLVRLPDATREVFIERLTDSLPNVKDKVLARIKRMRGGRLNRTEFGSRMVGDGPEWEAIDFIFRQTCDRLGIVAGAPPDCRKGSRRPAAPAGQLSLFAEDLPEKRPLTPKGMRRSL